MASGVRATGVEVFAVCRSLAVDDEIRSDESPGQIDESTVEHLYLQRKRTRVLIETLPALWLTTFLEESLRPPVAT